MLPSVNVSVALFITDAISEISSTTISPKLITFPISPVASPVIFSEIVREGGVLSITVICWVTDAKFSDASVAFQITVVSPIGKTAGALFVIVTCCISVTVDEPTSTKLLVVEVASKTILSGGMISGGVVSTTETNCVELAVFPEQSNVIHVIVVLPTPKNSGAALITDIIFPLSITDASPS